MNSKLKVKIYLKLAYGLKNAKNGEILNPNSSVNSFDAQFLRY